MPDYSNDSLFFTKTDLKRSRVETIVNEALQNSDDGELYLEYTQSENFIFDDGRLKNASFNIGQGFGLRAVADEATGFAHASDLSEDAIKRASASVQAVSSGYSGKSVDGPARTNVQLYTDENPLNAVPFEAKTKLLEDMDAYARSKDDRVRQVSCSISGEWTAVEIMRSDGQCVRDIRPLVRLNVSITAADGERQESGAFGAGGRQGYSPLLDPSTWQSYVDEALRQAIVNLQSEPAPAGEMEVVLGPGWTGILLHEAVGHGLEGDFNRKRTSAFAGLLGKRVASPGVTVVDDGTLEGRRGSLTVDDEGTPTSRTVLIENGILKGFMQDRLNARLMGAAPTGNGRRESYEHAPLPRMTNTMMMGGDHDPEEIIRSVKNGIYAVNFSGGQVDITSGKFVFNCTEAYRVQNGVIGAPLKGATLIGDGPSALTKVEMIGNDFELDPGVGVCGKAGQGVPVGVGQPTIKISAMTVGGTAG